MTTKYIVSRMFPGSPPYKVDVVRETASTLWVIDLFSGDEIRRKKDSAVRTLHDTEEEAWACAIQRAEAKVMRCREELESAEKKLAKLKENQP